MRCAGKCCGSEWINEFSRRWPAQKQVAVSRTRLQGMGSKAVLEGGEDQRSVCSHMRRGGAQRCPGQADLDLAGTEVAIVFHRPAQGAFAEVPCAVPSGALPVSSAATHVSHGMSAIRRNASPPGTEHEPALTLAPPPG